MICPGSTILSQAPAAVQPQEGRTSAMWRVAAPMLVKMNSWRTISATSFAKVVRGLPAALRVHAGSVAEKGIDFRGTKVARVDGDDAAAVRANAPLGGAFALPNDRHSQLPRRSMPCTT